VLRLRMRRRLWCLLGLVVEVFLLPSYLGTGLDINRSKLWKRVWVWGCDDRVPGDVGCGTWDIQLRLL
jgi:hypothetical protein